MFSVSVSCSSLVSLFSLFFISFFVFRRFFSLRTRDPLILFSYFGVAKPKKSRSRNSAHSPNDLHSDIELHELNSRSDSRESVNPAGAAHHRLLAEFPPYQPSLLSASSLLNSSSLDFLYRSLPPLLSLRDLRLIYSLTEDGAGLLNLYEKVSSLSCGPSILVVRDSRGFVFGCFTVDEWRNRVGYYGNSLSFVFSLYPNQRVYPFEPSLESGNADSACFQLSDHAFMAIGGGNNDALYNNGNNSSSSNSSISSGFAFHFDFGLLNGTSSYCSTFHSPILASANVFQIDQAELWGFT